MNKYELDVFKTANTASIKIVTNNTQYLYSSLWMCKVLHFFVM